MQKFLFFSFIITVLIINGCASVTPACSFHQGARIVPDHFNFTNSYTAKTYSENGGTSLENHSIGFQFGRGYREKPFFLPFYLTGDSRVRSELLIPKGGPSDTLKLRAFVMLEAKLSLLKDMLAVSSAMGGGPVFQYEFLILYLTLPFSKSFEFNFSPRIILMGCDDPNEYFAFTASFGIGPDLNKLAVRPEITYLLNTDGDSERLCFGLGLTFHIGEEVLPTE